MLIPPYLIPDHVENTDPFFEEFKVSRVLDIQVVSSIYEIDSNFIKIEKTQLLEYTDRQMVIQVDFLHPEMLSLDATDRDYITLRPLSSDFFRDVTGQQLSDKTVLSYPIERQLTIEDA